MFTMYKYPFKFEREVTIAMPSGPTMLSAQMQKDTPCLWAMVHSENELKEYKLACYWTGEEIKDADKLRFIATIQAADDLVWHVFEKYVD